MELREREQYWANQIKIARKALQIAQMNYELAMIEITKDMEKIYE
jgi:hypothetical protein